MNQKIPWLRIFVEGAVIVGSILLAFGIDAWWEEHQERVLEQEYLLAVLADIDSVIAEIDRTIAKNEELNEAVREHAATLRRGAQLSDANATPMLEAFGGSYRLRANLDTYTDLLSSGKVTILNDSRVRRTLAKLRAEMDFEQDVFLAVLDLGNAVRSLLHESLGTGNMIVIARLEEDLALRRDVHNDRKVEVREAANQARDAILAVISTPSD